MMGKIKQIIIENISSDELSNTIKNIISEQLIKFKRDSVEVKKDLMSQKDTAKFLDVTVRTLYNWTKDGILDSYSIGNRIYYKKTEIDKALIKIIK